MNNRDDSLAFYWDALGMKLLRCEDGSRGEFTLALVEEPKGYRIGRIEEQTQ